MKLNGAWIFYGDRPYKLEGLAERFQHVKEVNEYLKHDLIEHMIIERRDSGFMAMGLGESLRRAVIKHTNAIAVDGIEYIPEMWAITGNGFSFTWIVKEDWELPEQFRKKG